MKPPELQSRLWHVRDACEKVVRITAGMTIEQYAADELVPDSVVRQLTIVGEAVSRISKIDPPSAARLGPVARIISLRNQLVHNYPAVEHDAVWVVVQRDVPRLLAEVRALLAELENSGPIPG